MATTARLTIDNFERLPQEQAKNHELVDGELIPVPGNTPEHIDIQDLLIEVLRPFVRERRLGKVYAELEYDFGGNAHAPDLSFFGPAKKALMNRRKRVQRFVPDLAIEIAPANDTFGALLRKVQRYRSCGTEEVWIVVTGSFAGPGVFQSRRPNPRRGRAAHDRADTGLRNSSQAAL